MARTPFTAGAIALLATTVVLAGATETGYSITLLTGYDTNPLEVSKLGNGSDGLFGQLRLAGEVSRSVTRGLTLFADGQAQGRLHDQVAANADFANGALRLGFVLSPARAPRFALAAGGRYTGYRSTYVDRLTGEPYEVRANPDPDPPSTVEIADRLDYDSTASFLNLRWNQNRSLRLFVDSRLEHTAYTDDYSATTSLESLDFRARTIEPGVGTRLGGAAQLIFSVAWTDLEYDRQSALDAVGVRADGERRHYDYTQYRLTLRVTPPGRWSLSVGARAAQREDTFAGYYDYGAASGYVSVGRELGKNGALHFRAAYSTLDYPNATVNGDPEDRTLADQQRTLLARYERSQRDHVRWFVEGGVRRADSRDPEFEYASDWVLGGVEFRK